MTSQGEPPQLQDVSSGLKADLLGFGPKTKDGTEFCMLFFTFLSMTFFILKWFSLLFPYPKMESLVYQKKFPFSYNTLPLVNQVSC
jgi:hypothetical protein